MIDEQDPIGQLEIWIHKFAEVSIPQRSKWKSQEAQETVLCSSPKLNRVIPCKKTDWSDWKNITEHFTNKIDERKLGKVKDEEENYRVGEMN